jgi:hypothetical protein
MIVSHGLFGLFLSLINSEDGVILGRHSFRSVLIRSVGLVRSQLACRGHFYLHLAFHSSGLAIRSMLLDQWSDARGFVNVSRDVE